MCDCYLCSLVSLPHIVPCASVGCVEQSDVMWWLGQETTINIVRQTVQSSIEMSEYCLHVQEMLRAETSNSYLQLLYTEEGRRQ